MVWSCELRVVGCKTGCSQLYPVRLDCWSEVREHFTPLACFAGSARGQNRLMDRYSWPTNYWVNIKYPNMIFSFVGWRCPKSGRIAHYFFYPSPGSLQLFQTHFCSLVWMTSCNNHSTSAFVVGFFHQAQSHKQALKGWTGWWGNFTQKNWQKNACCLNVDL